MAVFDDTRPWEEKLLLYPHRINWQNNLPVPNKGEAERVDIPQDEPLKLECLHFLDCIGNGLEARTDGDEGLRVLRILNASQASLDQGGRKIDLKDFAGSTGDQSGRDQVFVNPTAVIDDDVEIGSGSKIWHFSHILGGSKIGENCNIGQNVVIGPDVTIGRQCKIQNNVSIYKGVTLEDGVFCGPSMVFTNIYNPRAEIRKMDQVRATLVKKGATIGANSTIVCGSTLGNYCFIGAGAVVNKNVPDHALVVGNPARQIGWACECGERLTEDLDCLACEIQYQEGPDGLVAVGS
jgi:acetyltransferase-like isoleucine patch superfamily enzyme